MARALRTTTFTEPKNISDVLKSEMGTISRDQVTILSGQGVLAIGTVLAKVTASGKYVAAVHDTELTDGTNVAVAVLLDNVDATAGDVPLAIVCSRLAEVSELGLVWASSVNDATKKGLKIANLAAQNIIVRATN